LKNMKPDNKQGRKFEIEDKHKWTGQDVEVNSNTPLVNEAIGSPYILRQFEFAFNLPLMKELRAKGQTPTKQD
jgi:hypothetical protein